MSNRNARGGRWTEDQILAVWQKGSPMPGNDPRVFRKDACGAPMRFDQHGLESRYGWEIDHIRPVAHQGSDHLSNLQPLQWQNNRHKADDLQWSCAVTA